MRNTKILVAMTDKRRNENAARRILEGWAEILVNGLDETMRVASGRSAG